MGRRMITTMVVAVHDFPGHLLRERVARHIRERRSTDKQRGDESKGHWAVHLFLLKGSVSIHCGASI
jgi:hypothetical protein